MSCCTNVFNKCSKCKEREYKQTVKFMEDELKYLKHRDDILFNGVKPDCSSCNDSGWIRCSCKECKDGQ